MRALISYQKHVTHKNKNSKFTYSVLVKPFSVLLKLPERFFLSLASSDFSSSKKGFRYSG